MDDHGVSRQLGRGTALVERFASPPPSLCASRLLLSSSCDAYASLRQRLCASALVDLPYAYRRNWQPVSGRPAATAFPRPSVGASSTANPRRVACPSRQLVGLIGPPLSRCTSCSSGPDQDVPCQDTTRALLSPTVCSSPYTHPKQPTKPTSQPSLSLHPSTQHNHGRPCLLCFLCSPRHRRHR